jgi:hypothetical protein
MMNERVSSSSASAKKSVIEVLAGHGKKALFATQLLAGLRRYNLDKDVMDQALAELEADSVVVLRDHFCADPHLAEVDLRVVALLERSRIEDAYAAALREIDLAWNQWLGEYLANHKCG